MESRPFPTWSNFRFTGDSLEYFRIWIVNILLTIITLGIYSAWAKVRTLRYFYGNTWLNDSSFSYLADPVKILKGRIIAVGILAVYWTCIELYPQASLWALAVLCLLLPFILVTAMAFRMRNTAYRNIRFYFQSDYAGAYRLFIIPIAGVLVITAAIYSLYLMSDLVVQMEEAANGDFRREDILFSIFILVLLPMIPYVDFIRRKFIIERTQYGTARGSFRASAWDFYQIYLLAFLLTMGLAVFFAMIFGIITSVTGITAGEGGEQPLETIGASFGLILVLFYVIGFFIMGYILAAIANTTWNNTEIGPLRLQSHLRGGQIGWLLLSNTVAIIFSLGLMIPWSKIRMARYVARNTEFLENRMETINAMVQTDRTAVGEELGDIFDLDLGL